MRATAQMVTGTQSSIREGVELAGAALNGFVLPAVRQRVPAARSESFAWVSAVDTTAHCPMTTDRCADACRLFLGMS